MAENLVGALNRFPNGLLELINSKVGGVTPSLLSQVATATIDLAPFLDLASTPKVNTLTLGGTLPAVPGAIGNSFPIPYEDYPIIPIAAVWRIDTVTNPGTATIQAIGYDAGTGAVIDCRETPPVALSSAQQPIIGIRFTRQLWPAPYQPGLATVAIAGGPHAVSGWFRYVSLGISAS